MIGSVVQCVPIEKWDNVDINRDEGDDEDRNKVAVRLKELLEKDARGIREKHIVNKKTSNNIIFVQFRCCKHSFV